MRLCDVQDAGCNRSLWTSFVPTILVLGLCFFRIFKFRLPVKRFLTLPEAEELAYGDSPIAGEDSDSQRVNFWRTGTLASIALAEALVWIAIGAYDLITGDGFGWSCILIAGTWLYASLRITLRPSLTPPYDLFSLYMIHLAGAIYEFGGTIYDHHVSGAPSPSPGTIAAHSANIICLSVLLLVVLRMPLAIPSQYVEKDKIGFSVSPEDYVPLWKWITFDWIRPLIERGTNTTLNESDVWALSPTFQSRPVYIKFNSVKQRTLLRWLWAANAFDILVDISLTLVSVTLSYAGPFFLKLILDTLSNPSPQTRPRAYIYAFIAFVAATFKAETDCIHLWFGRRAAARIRSSLMCEIHNKALKRKDFSGIVDRDAVFSADDSGRSKGSKNPNADDPKAGADVGKIVNLMATDANDIGMVTSNAYVLYGAPLEIIIAFTFLYQLLGTSAFAGFVVLILGWPLNSFLRQRAVQIQKGLSTARDKRMSVVSELINAVKFIKFFAWEDRWIQRAMDARHLEISWIVKSRINSVLFSLLYTAAPILVSIISFSTFVARGNELTVATAFTAIALFNMVRAPLNVIPTWVITLSQTKVAMDRISTFLGEDEVSEQVSTLKQASLVPGPNCPEDDEGLGIENGTFIWNEVETPTNHLDSASVQEDHRFELRDISVNFPDGELSVITGPTASGKTALLMALLGEMTMVQGRLLMSKQPTKVDSNGLTYSISYAAQSSWLQHQSIKDNILFGSPYDAKRYNEVVECCALKPDLEIFEDGDATEIGAKGVSLSGGQKARVALARAVYAHTKFVLLDDPLSAVDSHTARFLFERLLQGPLMTNRTVILVTHHVELVLPGTYYLIRMLDGRIDSQGTVKALRAAGLLDDVILDSALEAEQQEINGATDVESVDLDEADSPVDVDGNGSSRGEKNKNPRKLVKDEKREAGGVKWSIYRTYLQASSYWTWGILCGLIILAQLCSVGEKLWIKTWGEAYEDTTEALALSVHYMSATIGYHDEFVQASLPSHHLSALFRNTSTASITRLPSAKEQPFFYIGVYSAIALGTALISVASVTTQYTGALRASRLLFKQLLVSVVRATMRWHDTTPQGRMLNRFTRDIATVDRTLASSLNAVNQSMATFAASIITVSVVFPVFLIPAFFLSLAYRALAIGYLNTGRDLRRMESNSRSPIFSGFAEILDGLVTVRAFSAEQRFEDSIRRKIDQFVGIWITFWNTNRWLLLNFDTLGAFAVFSTTLLAIAGHVPAGTAGLCITSAMSFTTAIYWSCRYWTSLELDLNAVERVVEYTQDLPQEPPAIIESSRPPAYWPASSENETLVVVEDLVIKYAPELPAVLKGVSFSLKGRERVGLLGRTGSGKSTLAQSLLRFVDPAGGRILIDGVDITTIGVQDLRSQLTFIPQEASLFSGTLRENLDPFGEYTDSECLNVLLRVKMLTDSSHQSQMSSAEHSKASSVHHGIEREETSASVSSTPTETDFRTSVTLDTQVSAGGLNFSQGQRQLIALARALLRSSAIIILDEATSSIDFATDAKIQNTIREEFGNSLLLTVAHRLRTVIDYDRLIVLDNGTVVETGTPFDLIRREGGVFRAMCLKSGTFAELETAAKAKARRDQRARRSRSRGQA